jgi:hypothetical protein
MDGQATDFGDRGAAPKAQCPTARTFSRLVQAFAK